MNKLPQAPRTTVESAGSILRSAREARGIPIELVAHDLRMRPQQVTNLEQDDHDHLPHASYARLLILYYARYLNIAPSRVEPHLPEKWSFRRGGYQPVCRALTSENVSRNHKTVEFRSSSLPSRVFPAISTCCITLLLIILGLWLYFTYRHSREEQRLLMRTHPVSIQIGAPLTKPSPPSFDTVRTFDSALLETVPGIAAVNPPPLKMTNGENSERKAGLLKSALRMSFAPALPQLTPPTAMTSRRAPDKISR